MKLLLAEQSIDIPENVRVTCRRRVVKVQGPRGTLTRNFKHLNMETSFDAGKFKVSVWLAKRKSTSVIRTVCSHIENMITGVTEGFEYRMRFVAAHFPIIARTNEDKSVINLKNFLGERVVRTVPMQPGVEVKRTPGKKDEIILRGNDIEAVSKSAALIHHRTMVRNKDIRKFLDGVYVSEKNKIDPAVVKIEAEKERQLGAEESSEEY